jgi:hypothetical protein
LQGPESTINIANRIYDERNHIGDNKKLSEINILDFLNKSKHKYGRNWVDITYDEMNVLHVPEGTEKAIPIEIPDLSQQLISLCQNLFTLKQGFAEWSRNTKVFDVKLDSTSCETISLAAAEARDGNFQGVWQSESLLSEYRAQCNLLPSEIQNTYGITFSMVKTINNLFGNRQDKYEYENAEQLRGISVMKAMNMDLLNNESSIDDSAIESTFAGLNKSNEEVGDVDNTHNGTVIVEEGDACTLQEVWLRHYIHMLEINPTQRNIEISHTCREYMQFRKESNFRAQVPRLLGQGGMPLKPKLSKQDRAIAESELLTFSSLSAFDLHRFHMLHKFNEIIHHSITPTVNFTGLKLPGTELEDSSSILKRHYFRDIPAISLPQIFANELLTDPQIVRQYYPLSDELLLSFIWEPPNRRMGKKVWDPTQNMHMRPTYEHYQVVMQTQVCYIFIYYNNIIGELISHILEFHSTYCRRSSERYQYY